LGKWKNIRQICHYCVCLGSLDEAWQHPTTREQLQCRVAECSELCSTLTAAEIRIQAERRVGELQRRSRPLVLNEGGRPNTKTPANKERVFKPALEQAGIDYNL